MRFSEAAKMREVRALMEERDRVIEALREHERLLTEIINGRMPHGSVILAARQAARRILEG